MPEVSDIESTLAERGSRYGTFEGHAKVTQALKDVAQSHPNYHKLKAHHKEALDMIFHKIGRILNGDPNYADSWHDIAGYATLVEKIIAGEGV